MNQAIIDYCALKHKINNLKNEEIKLQEFVRANRLLKEQMNCNSAKMKLITNQTRRELQSVATRYNLTEPESRTLLTERDSKLYDSLGHLVNARWCMALNAEEVNN